MFLLQHELSRHSQCLDWRGEGKGVNTEGFTTSLVEQKKDGHKRFQCVQLKIVEGNISGRGGCDFKNQDRVNPTPFLWEPMELYSLGPWTLLLKKNFCFRKFSKFVWCHAFTKKKKNFVKLYLSQWENNK